MYSTAVRVVAVSVRRTFLREHFALVVGEKWKYPKLTDRFTIVHKKKNIFFPKKELRRVFVLQLLAAAGCSAVLLDKVPGRRDPTRGCDLPTSRWKKEKELRWPLGTEYRWCRPIGPRL